MSQDVTFQDLYDEYAHLSRSERVAEIFNFSPVDFQADLLDYHEEQAKTQAAPKKGRQVGASLVGGALAADYALWNPGEDVLITSAKQDPADELFDKFTEHYKNSDLSLEQLGVVEDNKTEWRFSHGTRVLCRTLGQGDLSQRSLNPSFVIVDEAAYASDYHLNEVIEPYFITHPEYEYYLFSTPKGKSGYFYHAVEGNNAEEWYSPHWPTEISPFADEDYLERKRREKDATSYAQEYKGEFADTGEVWIPSDLFRSCVGEMGRTRGSDDRYLGVDIARKGADETVYLDLDERGNVRNCWSEETSNLSSVAGRIRALHREHSYTKVLVDENSVGGGVVDNENLAGIVTGVTFSSKSKHEMYTALRNAFEREELTVPPDTDNYRKIELQTTGLEFEYTQNGYLKIGHAPGGHDDYPDALALANFAREGLEREFASANTGKAAPTFKW